MLPAAPVVVVEEFDTENQDDSSSEGTNAAWTMLLGGLTVDDISTDAWEQQSQHSDQGDDQQKESTATKTTALPVHATPHYRPCPTTFLEKEDGEALDPALTAYAHTWSTNTTTSNSLLVPPQSIRLINDPSKGQSLVLRHAVTTGTTLWTEQAAAWIALPSSLSPDQPSRRVCQACAKSLVRPADHEAWPYLQAWPIPPYDQTIEEMRPFVPLDFPQNDNPPPRPVHGSSTKTSKILPDLVQDQYGRITCRKCQAWFCQAHCCRTILQETLFTCCVWRQIDVGLSKVDDSDDKNEYDPLVHLATRVFGQVVQTRRHHNNNSNNHTATYLDWMCGNVDDMEALGFTPGQEQDLLRRIYDQVLVPAFQLTPPEQQAPTTPPGGVSLSYTVWKQCVAVAARNAVGLRLQSPWSAYHAAVVRRYTGGFGHDAHAAVTAQWARILNTSNNKNDSKDNNHRPNNGTPRDISTTTKSNTLNRSLDDKVKERFAPEIAAIFPLTAKLNHACPPHHTAVLQANFATAAVDVVVEAAIDSDRGMLIPAGQEVTISYLPPSRATSTAQRKHALQAKYLFDCTCPACV